MGDIVKKYKPGEDNTDIMLSIMQKYAKEALPVTDRKVKKAILEDFVKETSLTERQARHYYNQVAPNSLKSLDIGALTLQAVYKKYELMRDFSQLSEMSEKDIDKIMAKRGEADVLKSLSDTLGKLDIVSVNRDKNTILEKKVTGDMNLGLAELGIKYTELSVDAKKQLLKERFKNQKSLRGLKNEITGDDFEAKIVDG